jgi:PAS domain S-box-containing protein
MAYRSNATSDAEPSRSEVSLREERETLQPPPHEVADILESITDAFFALDEDWRFTHLNTHAEELLGCRREELLGKSVWDAFPEAVGSTFDEQYRRAAEQQVSVQFEEWYPPLETWFEVEAYPRAQGGLTIFFNDISERKQREQALRQAKEQAQQAKEKAEAASRAKSRFLANMGHELRTPLNAIIGYSEMYLEEPADWERNQVEEDMRSIHRAGHQLLAHFDDLLHLAKAESGKLNLALGTFPFPPLVDEVVERIQSKMEEDGNALYIEGAKAVGQICTDRSKLRQILYNLLSNAAKYTQEGDVTLRARIEHRLDPEGAPQTGMALEERTEEGEESYCTPSAARRVLVLEVSDTGTGMTEEEQEWIFGAFERSEENAGSRGIGLGLSLTRDLCKMLGGRIGVESEKGVGSTFTVRVPVEVMLPSPRP